MMGLPGGRKSFKIGLVTIPAVTDSHPRCCSLYRAYYIARVKRENFSSFKKQGTFGQNSKTMTLIWHHRGNPGTEHDLPHNVLVVQLFEQADLPQCWAWHSLHRDAFTQHGYTVATAAGYINKTSRFTKHSYVVTQYLQFSHRWTGCNNWQSIYVLPDENIPNLNVL